MKLRNGVLITTVAFLLLLATVGASDYAELGKLTEGEASDLYLSLPPTRLQHMYSRTGPVPSQRVEETPATEASDECWQAALQLLAGNYTNGLRMWFYSGKEPGDYGNYLECQELTNAHFCTVRYSIFNITTVLVSSGLCVPSVCSEQELLWALKHLPNPSWWPVFDAVTVECVPKTQPPLSRGGIVTVLFITVLSALVVVATLVDLIRRLVLRPEEPLADPRVENFEIAETRPYPLPRSRSVPVFAAGRGSINTKMSDVGAHVRVSTVDGSIRRLVKSHSSLTSSSTREDLTQFTDDDTTPSSTVGSFMSSDEFTDDDIDDEDDSDGLVSRSRVSGRKRSPSTDRSETSSAAPLGRISKRSTTKAGTSGKTPPSQSSSSAARERMTDAFDDVDGGKTQSQQEKLQEEGEKQPEPLPPPSSTWMKILFCFSAAENLSRLVRHYPNNKTNLNPLNFIRVVGMLWVLLGHTVLFTVFIGYTNPVQAVTKLLPTVPMQVILNATLSVDIFFYLAGFLMTYFTLKELRQRQGRLNWFVVLLHRLWRMTPTMLLALFFCWTVAPSLGNGPWWRTFMKLTMAACKKYWWTNVLYINNFWNFDLDQTCLAWTWYMSTDMQFFLVAIPLVYLIYRWPRIGFSALTLLSLASLAYVLGISAKHNFSPIPIKMDDGFRKYIYTKPWARFSTFAIGVLGAYMLLAHEQRVSTPHGFRRLPFIPQSLIVSLAWIVSLVLLLSTMFGTYSAYQVGAAPWRTARNTAYLTLSRPAFTLGLAIMAHLIMTSRASVSLKDLLSHPLWTPFARLTFGAYLYHPIIMFGYYFSSYTPIELTGTLIFQNWLAFSALSFLVAAFSYLLIERPTESLEALLLGYFKARAKKAHERKKAREFDSEAESPLLEPDTDGDV